ncbi:MAG: hypothetical protein ACE5OZ_11430 [Candidatus Heimdallarchaeota archaeon]
MAWTVTDEKIAALGKQLEEIFQDMEINRTEPEAHEIVGEIWLRIQQINFLIKMTPDNTKPGLLDLLKGIVKKLAENFATYAGNLGASSYSIGVSGFLSIQLTLTWEVS